MAKRRANRGSGSGAGRSSAGRRSSSGGSGSTVASLAVVAAVLAGGTYLYRHTAPGVAGRPPALESSTSPAPALSAVPPERMPPEPAPAAPVPGKTGAPAASIATAGAPPAAPFGTSEEVFEGGARLYAANCAGCHGRPGRNAKGPTAAQFWDRGNAAGVRAVAQPTGAIYNATASGNLVGGMPSYGQRLTDTQLWDLALLLKNAHEDLPEPVLHLLHGGE